MEKETMNIIAVDDENPSLALLEDAIKDAVPDCVLNTFTTAKDAIAYAKTNQVDIAFLDIEMSEMNGLVLAKCLKDIYIKTNIIFATAHVNYAYDAFSMKPSGYLMKPVTPEKVIEEINNLRYPVKIHDTEKVRIKCFGRFSVIVDGEPLVFKTSKAKELLAFLVHKDGDSVNNAEIAAVLWEDKPYNISLQSQTRRAIGQLRNILKDAGIGYIILKSFNSISIDVNKVSCDYHEFLKGNVAALNAYTGEYMSQYSWAEFTIGYLNSKVPDPKK